ncbi:MAG: hypothetical protein COB66_01960 [Coxiella sp. (in: Bacteria)]|nr:MAG: hypothetical protein COB66_01960 [Coxiella sp. (in: g-proteobacteria)]
MHCIKKLMVTLLFACPSLVLALPFYLGGEGGYGFINYNNIALSNNYTATAPNKTRFAARPVGGYFFNRYIGVELSTIYFMNPEFTSVTNSAGTVRFPNKSILNNLTYAGAIGNISLLAKRLYLQPLVGIGFIGRKGILDGNTIVLKQGTFVRPVFGLGFRVMMHKGWYASTAWRYTPMNKSDQLPATNFVGVGAGYQFE